MHGSIKGQIMHLFSKSGINKIGQSKLQAKSSARMALAAEGRSGTSTNVAGKTGIHAISTKENYLDKWEEIARFAKEEYGIRDLEKISTDIIKEFLEEKIEKGVSYTHWSGYAAAVCKLEKALNDYSTKYDRGNSYDLRQAVSQLRPVAAAELPRFEGQRNYADPNKLICVIKNPAHQLAAKIQYESGLRIAGATSIRPEQLRGITSDKFTGKAVGQISYIGKGGKAGTAQMSPVTYAQLVEHIARHGSFAVSQDGYRGAMKQAAKLTGQQYNGSHGLRWNFAQERFCELQAAHVSYETALGAVSNELGHNRIGITYHYLGLD